MVRALLNSVPTFVIVLVGVGGMAALTVVVVLVARRLFPQLTDSDFEPVANSLRTVYELIFALILAFVIAAVLDEMTNAESVVASEATTIGELVRANDTLPGRDRLRLDRSVEQYVRAVANHEWKTMQDGKRSAQAASALEGMYAEYRRVQPRGAAQTEDYSQALDNLHEIATLRRERLNIAAADLPTMLRVLVVVGLFVLLVLEYRPQLSFAAGLVFMGTLAVVATSAFLLTVVLNYPFAGDVSISNAAFKHDNLARFWSQELAYRPKASDDERPLTAVRLQGVWNSDAFGTLVMSCEDPAQRDRVRDCRRGDRRMRGVYRYHDGTVTGEISNGVFRGWWTESPRRGRNDSGLVRWRLLDTAEGEVVYGTWSYAYDPLTPGWDLQPIGGTAPPDLQRRFSLLKTFQEDPRGRPR